MFQLRTSYGILAAFSLSLPSSAFVPSLLLPLLRSASTCKQTLVRRFHETLLPASADSSYKYIHRITYGRLKRPTTSLPLPCSSIFQCPALHTHCVDTRQ
ncbi:hypothetical protein GGR50DRAFT_654523 [Xylaria sp. CBS 124048]|nr:hypothetical protein GGR50DRAFT_654523 [Xylaria sp. CBS 124048]